MLSHFNIQIRLYEYLALLLTGYQGIRMHDVQVVNDMIDDPGTDAQSKAQCVLELIRLRHHGYKLPADKYADVCDSLIANEDEYVREVGQLGSEILCGRPVVSLTSHDVSKMRVIDVLASDDWVTMKSVEADMVRLLAGDVDDWVTVLNVVRVLDVACGDGRWDKRSLIEYWTARYARGVRCGALLGELVSDDVKGLVLMMRHAIKIDDRDAVRWCLQKLSGLGVRHADELKYVDWDTVLGYGDVYDLVFGVLRGVREWSQKQGRALVSVLLHCALFAVNKRCVWLVVLRILESGTTGKTVLKMLPVLAKTGDSLQLGDIERFAKVVGGYPATSECLNEWFTTGCSERFAQLYVLVMKSWGSGEHAAAVKRYSVSDETTRLLITDWVGNLSSGDETDFRFRRREIEGNARRHRLRSLPPIGDYIRMQKFDVGVFQMGDEKVKFKITRDKCVIRIELRWSSDIQPTIQSFGSSYTLESTIIGTTMQIVITVHELYVEAEEPLFELGDESRRLPIGLKTLVGQGMPRSVFDERWNVLAGGDHVGELPARTVERIGGAVIDEFVWCGLAYTSSGIVGVLSMAGIVKCTKCSDVVVSRFRRCV